MRNSKNKILVLIVLAQFFCTSVWFAGNGVMTNLIEEFGLAPTALGHITSSVQFGFIVGTLLFALLTISDRYSPSRVFFFSALLSAIFNLGMVAGFGGLSVLLILRFMTGFFLAGIYPVGMKIASDYFNNHLGKALGFLVGALVIGTAFPHLLKNFTGEISWRMVIVITSIMSAAGGLMILVLVPDGPHKIKSSSLDFHAFLKVFKDSKFRSAAFGYFGHMWELYAFWAFVPIILSTYIQINPDTSLNIPLYSFLIIGCGGVSCVLGGYFASAVGSKKVAFYALLFSGICCLLSPFFFHAPAKLATVFLLLWGLTVVADSPQFSTLVAQHAPPQNRGTALTIVNCIGFALTIVSIQILSLLSQSIDPTMLYLVLAPGPLLGLMALKWGKGY